MASIIKAGQIAGGVNQPRAAAFQLADVSDQANAYVTAARTQAQEILAAAQREADAIRKRAEQQGLQAAIARVEQTKRREVGAQLQSLLPALEKSIQAFVDLRQNWVQRWEKHAVQIACAMASRIVRQEVSARPQIALELLQETLELAAGSNLLRVHLHPDDCQLLGDEARQICDAWQRAVKVEIVADANVPKGSCRATTEHGEIDQRFAEQLARIEQELTL